jgi:hypothetical protein
MPIDKCFPAENIDHRQDTEFLSIAELVVDEVQAPRLVQAFGLTTRVTVDRLFMPTGSLAAQDKPFLVVVPINQLFANIGSHSESESARSRACADGVPAPNRAGWACAASPDAAPAHVLGIDLAKNVFQLHGVDRKGHPVNIVVHTERNLIRARLKSFFTCNGLDGALI